MTVRPAKTQISLGIRPVWSETSLCAQWVAKDPSFLHADSKDSDQTERMPRLIWVFAGHTCYFVGFVMRRLKLFKYMCVFHFGNVLVSEIVYGCYTIRIHASPGSCRVGEHHFLGVGVLPRRPEGHPPVVRPLVRGAYHGTLELGGVKVATCEHTERKPTLA